MKEAFPFFFVCVCWCLFSIQVMNVKAIKTEEIKSWGLRERATSCKDIKPMNVLSVRLLEAKNGVEASWGFFFVKL